MIVSFGDRVTEALFHGAPAAAVRRVPTAIRARAARKLDMLNAAASVQDLRAPPGNRLESLTGDLAGFHSVRVNEQWRIVFRWEADGAHEVRIADYHG